VNADSRLVHVNQTGITEIGSCLVDAIVDIAGEEGGEFAILSATSQAVNQNAWVKAIQTELEKNDRGLTLVKIAYDDDEFQKSDVLLTGLGLPSEMKDYIGEDNVCPYMFLWNPGDLGKLAGYTAAALATGEITGVVGDKYTAGNLGEYTIVTAKEGGTEVIPGPPF